MKNDIDLSIVVPVYNVEKYLDKCLNSLLTQETDKNFKYEIICINDNSSDGCAKILKFYQEKGVQVITHLENKGLGAARNSGINKATGRYISFVDSDDWVSSNYIKEISKAIDKEPVKIMFSYKKITKNGNFIVKLNKNGFDHPKYSYIIPCSWTKVYKKEKVNLFKYEKEKYEDLKYVVDEIIENKITEVLYVDKPLYNYNQLRDTNIMSGRVQEEDMCAIFKNIDLKELNKEQRELICEIMIIRFILYGIMQKNKNLFVFFIKKLFLEYSIFIYVSNFKYRAGLFYKVENARGVARYKI